MSTVRAKHDIVSDKGFRVARAGDVGTPVPDAKPCRPEHWNKVRVVWRGRSRGYWCDPAALHARAKLKGFLALQPEHARASVPVSSAGCEFHFGRNLRRLREARNVTQSELARAMTKAGFSAAQSTVCCRERRADAPGSLFVAAAAKALAVQPFVFHIDWTCRALTDAKAFLCRMSSALCLEPEERDG